MELLQLLKTLGDQSSQGNMQEQINQLRLSFVDFVKFSAGIQIFLVIVFSIFIIIQQVILYRLDKRLKKIECEVEKLDRKVWPEYYQAKDEAEAREKFAKDVLLNKVSCVE
ncbi:MAG: hypothetical protein IMZ61_00110, partial [Planctomycetes bacterium]|nr:hypothetical protein [Planctomycetota bacterium]